MSAHTHTHTHTHSHSIIHIHLLHKHIIPTHIPITKEKTITNEQQLKLTNCITTDQLATCTEHDS